VRTAEFSSEDPEGSPSPWPSPPGEGKGLICNDEGISKVEFLPSKGGSFEDEDDSKVARACWANWWNRVSSPSWADHMAKS